MLQAFTQLLPSLLKLKNQTRLATNIQFWFSSSINKKPSSHSSHSSQSSKIDKPKRSLLQKKLAKFEMLKKQFVNNYSKYESFARSIVIRDNLNYLAWFARSTLICHQHLKVEEVFRTVKAGIKHPTAQLTPHSATLLMETLTYFKFEGDENSVLEKLCNYYEEMHWMFTETEQKHFWINYMKIMGQKVHTTVKFKPLDHKKSSRQGPLNLEERLSRFQKVGLLKRNEEIVRRLEFYQEGAEVMMTCKDYGLVRMKQFSPIEKIYPERSLSENERSKILKEYKKNKINLQGFEEEGEAFSDQQNFGMLMEQIMQMNKVVKKGWKVIIHGPSQSSLKTGLIKLQDLQQIKENFHYEEGICYSHQNPKTRTVLQVETILLGINKSYIDSKRVYFCNSKQKIQNQIAKYFTEDDVKRVIAYAEIYQLHWKLFLAFNQIQQWQASQDLKKEKRELGLDEDEDEDDDDRGKDQNELMSQEQSEQLAELAIKKVKQIGVMNLSNKYYGKKWRERSLLDVMYNLHWSFQPFFADAQKLLGMIEKITRESSESSRQKQSQSKTLIFTSKQSSLYLLTHYLEKKVPNNSQLANDPQTLSFNRFMLAAITGPGLKIRK